MPLRKPPCGLKSPRFAGKNSPPVAKKRLFREDVDCVFSYQEIVWVDALFWIFFKRSCIMYCGRWIGCEWVNIEILLFFDDIVRESRMHGTQMSHQLDYQSVHFFVELKKINVVFLIYFKNKLFVYVRVLIDSFDIKYDWLVKLYLLYYVWRTCYFLILYNVYCVYVILENISYSTKNMTQ